MTKEELEKEAEESSKEAFCIAHTHEDELIYRNGYLAGAEPREKYIAELKAQIEKMKCCSNCKHSRTEYEHCITNKHEKWEMKEK